MTVRLSTGLRNKMLDGGTGGGFKGALNHGFINIYSGPQPLTADLAATGTLLGTVSVDGGGTGITFEASAAGVIAKTITEHWKATGLAVGTAGWARMYSADGNPAVNSATDARMDLAIASSGGDATLSNMSFAVGAPSTFDGFTFTLPAQ